MLKKVSNKENVFMFFRDKLRHGPFPKLKTAIFIKIAKIIKNHESGRLWWCDFLIGEMKKHAFFHVFSNAVSKTREKTMKIQSCQKAVSKTYQKRCTNCDFYR